MNVYCKMSVECCYREFLVDLVVNMVRGSIRSIRFEKFKWFYHLLEFINLLSTGIKLFDLQ